MIRLAPQLLTQLNQGGPDAVQQALVTAVRLEHSTIPLYLYALYSLDEQRNAAVADIVQSVVVEEMLHMTLACNLLNAVGGTPRLDDPGFLPLFPGTLPGQIESDQVFHLRAFSNEQLKDFMRLEEPDRPLAFRVAALAEGGPDYRTIGDFYRAIATQMKALAPSDFQQRNQVGPEQFRGAVVVKDLSSALSAIQIIIDQGEGTDQSPEEVFGDDVAHYYRFAEVFHGRRLVPNPKAGPGAPVEDRYIYAGDPVVFDPAGCYAVPTDPKSAGYPAGSAARRLCDGFNYTYTSLLKRLNAAFNGKPEQIGPAIRLMMSLRQQAKDMMTGINPAGAFVGPSFEYQPLEPS